MARDLADAFPAARRALDECDRALTPDVPSPASRVLSSIMFDGPAEELTLTHNAQPALLAHGAAVWAAVGDALRPHVRAAAGHSLGESTAYHATGSLSLTDAIRLVRARGELMYRTGVEHPGAMAAILGTLTRSLDDICREAATAGRVVPANYNAAEQVVLSGEVAAVDRAIELAKAAGAKRAMRLNVSGAFHSPLMEPAVDGLRAALAQPTWHRMQFPVYSNVDAQPNAAAPSAKDLLLRQVTAPVQWVQLVRNITNDHPGAAFVELGPGNVLSGLIKRIVPGAETITCGTAAEAQALVARLA